MKPCRMFAILISTLLLTVQLCGCRLWNDSEHKKDSHNKTENITNTSVATSGKGDDWEQQGDETSISTPNIIVGDNMFGSGQEEE